MRKTDKLVEATILALQGKLELKEHRVSRKTKKSEGIDVNVDDNTTVSVEGNETIVDTQDATVIVNKKEDTFIPETSDDVPMEAPTVDAPVAPDDDMVEVPADDTVMPEEVVDEPVDTELPTENTLGESKKFKSKKLEALSEAEIKDMYDKYLKDELEKRYNEYCYEHEDEDDIMDFYKWLDEYGDIETEEIEDEFYNNLPNDLDESKKYENINIEVSDDGKEVEVTTDNGEEVEVKNETPEEGKDTEIEDIETEIPADDEPSIDEMIEENKKITEEKSDKDKFIAYEKVRRSGVTNMFDVATVESLSGLSRADILYVMQNYEKLSDKYGNEVIDENKKVTEGARDIADIINNEEWYDNNKRKQTLRGMLANKIADVADEMGDDYSEWVSEVDFDEIIEDITNSPEWRAFDEKLNEIIAEAVEDKVDWTRRDEPASRYYTGNPDLEESKKVEDTEEYLEPRYDSRASFYKKAKVVTKDNGDEELYSYGTHVGGVRGGKPYSKGRFSQTTSRHQKEFFKQRGVDPNKVDVEEGKQADKNKEEIEAKRCSNCIKHENKARSKKVQEMIARRQKKSEALNNLNKTVKRHRAVLEHKKVQETKNDLNINEGIPKKEEPVPNTEEAKLKVENKFSSKTFNEVLTKYYKNKIIAVENVQVTKVAKTRTGLKIEANLISKSGKIKRTICLEAKQIQTGNSFDKYELVETKDLMKENKENNKKVTMTTFRNKHNVIECRYILSK